MVGLLGIFIMSNLAISVGIRLDLCSMPSTTSYDEMALIGELAAELLVRGERSPIVTVDDVDHYRAVVTDLRVEQIAGAGHNIHGEQPGALGSTITAFLDVEGGGG